MLDDILAALCVVVVDEPPDDVCLRRVLGWAVAVWGHGIDDAPLALIHDVGFVLLRGRSVRLMSGRERFATSADFDDNDDDDDDDDDDDNDDDVVEGDGDTDVADLNDTSSVVVDDHVRAVVRAARLRFEEQVLGWLLRDESLRTATVIIGGVPQPTQDMLVVHVLQTVLPRLLTGVSLPRHQPGPLRGLLERAGSLARLRLGTGGTGRFVRPLVDLMHVQGAAVELVRLADARLADSNQPGRALLQPEEVWELSRLQALPSEALRLALRTVHRTMAGIGPLSPAMVRQLKDRRAQVITDDTQADTFPAGGFDAMSTHGILENMVRSEVAYVGVGAEDDPRRPDLFDVRFVEGELLYYTRDESPLLERRRTLVVHLDQVERSRHKLAELPTQTLVLVQAAVLRAHTDLQVALGSQVVHTAIAVTGADTVAVDEERALLSMSLADDIAHRRAEVTTLAELPLLRRVTFSVLPTPQPPPTVRGWVWVRVGGRTWQVASDTGVVEIDPRTDLRQLVDRLMLQA
jgi:hypothetical protein